MVGYCPKVSVCIPAFNQAQYIRRALESIRLQNFDDYEVIIADDSPDDSVETVVREFHLCGKIVYQRNPKRKGSPGNWNEAIRLSQGEYVKILHHDDWFAEKDSLFKLVNALETNKVVDFAFCATYVNHESSQTMHSHSPSESQLDQLRKSPLILFSGNFIGPPSTTIFRRRYDVEFDEHLKWVVDIDFYMKELIRNPRFVFIPEPLTCTTSGSPNQVSCECVGNRKVELYEWLYLYCKIGKAHKINFQMFKAIKQMLKRYHIKSCHALTDSGVDFPLPIHIRALTHYLKLVH